MISRGIQRRSERGEGLQGASTHPARFRFQGLEAPFVESVRHLVVISGTTRAQLGPSRR